MTNIVQTIGILMVLILTWSATALADSALSGSRTVVLEVGTPQAAEMMKEIYDDHPNMRGRIKELRAEMGRMDYGDKVEIAVEFYRGEVTSIDWKAVAATAAVGVVIGTLWTLFGGEILCAVGVAPACACVGPQC